MYLYFNNIMLTKKKVKKIKFLGKKSSARSAVPQTYFLLYIFIYFIDYYVFSILRYCGNTKYFAERCGKNIFFCGTAELRNCEKTILK